MSPRIPKCAVVIGTRPEAVKVCSLVKHLREFESSSLCPVVLSTGQHTDLMTQVRKDLDFEIDVEGPSILHGGDLNILLTEVIRFVSPELRDLRPDFVLVQGDTSSALGGAIAAVNSGLPVVHLEAGLRSFHLWEPFPEELNRRAISRLASFHLATSRSAQENLIREGIEPIRIMRIQTPIIDTLRIALAASDQLPSPTTDRAPLLTVTLHRREDREARFQALHDALSILLSSHPTLEANFVWHPSLDHDQAFVRPLLEMPRVKMIPPQSYFDFVALLTRSSAVITDSGGVTEEAAALSIPTIVLRRLTERHDLVESFRGLPVGVSASSIVHNVRLALDVTNKPATSLPPYHVGATTARILIDLVLPALGEVERWDLR